MYANIYVILSVSSSLFGFCQSQSNFKAIVYQYDELYEGDLCMSGGKSGKCTSILDCPKAIERIHETNYRPDFCNFIDDLPVVCCVEQTNSKVDPIDEQRSGIDNGAIRISAESMYKNLLKPNSVV